jgi:hypothetical protein
MILFCFWVFFFFFLFRSMKWLTNTRTSQCLPQFFSSLSLSPLVASHRNEVAARCGSCWCVRRLSCPSPIFLLSLYSAERAALCHLHKLLYLLALLKDSPHSFKEIRTTREDKQQQRRNHKFKTIPQLFSHSLRRVDRHFLPKKKKHFFFFFSGNPFIYL